MEREKGIWVTKDGRIIKINDMADGHLVNATALLRRTVGKMRFDYDLSAYSMLNICNGEMAQDAIESELLCDAQMSNEEWLECHTSYGELMEEVVRRGIAYMIGGQFFTYMDRFINMETKTGMIQ